MVNNFKLYLLNLLGWRTKRKIVVFESDDWGSIRMPSKANLQKLIKKGIRVDASKYDSLDCLENKEDLECLFEILSKYEGGCRNHPKFTFNTVLGNPDFEAIKKNHFSNFVHEHFFDSYENYYGQNLKPHWFSAIKNGLVVPQFHAREHLNSRLWMKDLANGNAETLTAFNLNFFGIKTKTGSNNQKHYLAAYYAENEEELIEVQKIAKKGINIFDATFGFKPRSFIGCNYLWPKALEQFLKLFGIDYIQGQRGHTAPQLNTGRRKVFYHYTGQQNEYKQIYLVRNSTFEPYLDQDEDWGGKVMREISFSFRFGKPAIISTHRINYVSSMDIANRDRSLKKLDTLLAKIIQRWPDVEFLSSDELGRLISNEISKNKEKY